MTWNLQWSLGHMTSRYMNQPEKGISCLFRDYSVCAQDSALNYACVSSRNPHNDLSRQALLLAPFCQCKN